MTAVMKLACSFNIIYKQYKNLDTWNVYYLLPNDLCSSVNFFIKMRNKTLSTVNIQFRL